MKINSIQYINPIKRNILKSNPLNKNQRQTILSNHINDYCNISFCSKKEKYSDKFVQLTQGDKDLQESIIEICMIDKEKFSSELEHDFLAINDIIEESYPEEFNLIEKALITRGCKNLLSADYIDFFAENIKQLKEAKYNLDDIIHIFTYDNFDSLLPLACMEVREKNGNFSGIISEIYFVEQYGKDLRTGGIDLQKISEISEIFDLLNITDIEDRKVIHSLITDKDGAFNEDKSDFIYDSFDEILEYCQDVDDINAAKTWDYRPDFARKLMIRIISAFIQSNEAQYNKFNFNIAKNSFDEWFKYVINNQEKLNSTIRVTFIDEENERIELNINEINELKPELAPFYDNIIHKFYAVLINGNDTIN